MSFNTLILGDNETECLMPPFLPHLSSIFFSLIHLPIPLICHVIAYELPDSFLTPFTIHRFQCCLAFVIPSHLCFKGGTETWR